MKQGTPMAPKRILCVQNDLDSAELVAHALKRHQYRVELVSTYYGGLSKARENYYDLILLDYYFPDGSGPELCQQIRQFDRRTPILFYSAEGRKERIRAALEVGAQGFLVKPIDPEDLLRDVKRHTGELNDARLAAR